MGADREFNIRVTVDGDGAVKVLGDVDKALDGVEKTTDKAGGGFSRFQANLVTFNQGLQAATSIVRGITSVVGGLVGSVTELANRGERLGSAVAGFEALGGVSSTIDEARDRTLGLVSAVELYELANKGLVAGLPDVNKNFGDIADLGARLANTLGKDVKGTIEQLTQAIATGRSTQLQQLGIFVDTKLAAEEYAAELGKTADQLTELEKKTAVQNASLAEVRRSLGEVAEVTDSGANAYTRLQNTIDDVTDSIGLALNENPKLAETFNDLTAVVRDNEDAIVELATVIIDLSTRVFGFFIGQIPNFLRGLNFLRETVNGNSLALVTLAESAAGVAKFLGPLGPAALLAERELSKLRQGILQTAEGADQAARILGTYSKELSDSEPPARRASEAAERLNRSLESTPRITTQAIAAQKQLREEFEKFNLSIDDLLGIGPRAEGLKALEEQLKSLFSDRSSGVVGLEELRKGLLDAAKDANGLGLEFNEVLAVIQRINGEEIKPKVESGGFLGAILDELGLVKEATTKTADEIAAETNRQIASSLAGAFSLALDFAFGDAQITGESVGGALGSIVGSFFGASEAGGAIGGVLGKIVDKLLGSTQNEETLLRRRIEEFINNALNESALQIRTPEGIIDFERIILPNKKDFGNGVFDTFVGGLQEAEPGIFASFQAVFGALGEQIEGDFRNGVKIGAILLDNLGGSMDELRLLVQVLGLDLGQLEEAITSAFLKGEIGALEAASAFRDLGDAFEPGRVGVGDLEGAIDDLIFSAGRGRRAIKALQDLGIEAQERGAQSLEDLKQELIAGGQLTQAQIDELFKNLEQNGVNSLDQLINASDRLGIAILGSLEASGLFFEDLGTGVDEVDQKLERLNNNLDNIADRQVFTDLTIRVRTEYLDSGARAAFDVVRAGGPGVSQ